MTALAFCLLCLVSISGQAVHAAEPAKADRPRPNVVFIAIDDLNHWVGHLGRNKQTKTPNLDRMAGLGVTFTHAYCAAPVCNPSRAALLSGMRPGATGVYDNHHDWRDVVPVALTLPTAFRGAGYRVTGAGKIYHGNFDRDEEWDDYLHSKGDPKSESPVSAGPLRPFGPVDQPDSNWADFKSVDYGIAELGKQHDRPFFVAVGLHKPHMAWNVPRKYYDLHPLDQIELPPYQENDLDDVPAGGLAMASPKEHDNIVKAGRWKEAIQGYLAAVSFADAQVGRLLDAIEKSPERNRTIVVLWGDHGWNLGEKHHWRKFALWEETTRAPLIWIAPGVTTAGTRCDRPVDFMSIYPTLCDLCQIAPPKHLQGRSLRPLLVDPKSPWDRPAITTFGRNNHAVRTEGWRYIHYADGGEELYDEVKDPYEWKNLAGDATYARQKTELAALLPTENKPEADRNGARQAKRAETKASD
ncbi:MAG TPA: sulfatase [Pirellulales bacterium]|jgi:arylsulfatase A-like enzyme